MGADKREMQDVINIGADIGDHARRPKRAVGEVGSHGRGLSKNGGEEI